MEDIDRMSDDLVAWSIPHEARPENALQWLVMASAVPGVFNLGGDLGHFAERIRSGDGEALRHYGHVAVNAVYRNTLSFGLPIVTIALVQGDALGGGFEHALSFDVLIAERGTRLGLPEIVFGLFPGMGAFSFLTRKIGRAATEALILSGRLRSAEELHEIGVVDVLADRGGGEQAVERFIAKHVRKHSALRGIHQARKLIHPVTLTEMLAVVDVWAAAALRLTESDLRRMARLVQAQDRKTSGDAQGTGAGLAMEIAAE